MEQPRGWMLDGLGELMKVNTTIVKNIGRVNQNWEKKTQKRKWGVTPRLWVGHWDWKVSICCQIA